MEAHCIPFSETGYFSKIVDDYLIESEDLKNFYELYPTLKNFKKAVQSKGFPEVNRIVLTDRLTSQYGNDKVKLNEEGKVAKNVNLLKKNETYTITTGHQLCLFTGPLYFIYKIVSAIKLCESLKKDSPDLNFIPVYWMATEDHDFAEVNHFNFKGKKIQWNTDQKGGVGRFKLSGLEQVYLEFSSLLTDYNENTNFLRQLFE